MEPSFEIRGNNNKFDFPPILNACIYQSLDPYNSKNKDLRESRNIISWYFEAEEQDSAIKFLEFLDQKKVKIYLHLVYKMIYF